ncbi:MAG TPA: hypothetical protein GXZ56_00215 [Bacteroidales bacterium]|jgi:hypothetical protein|nr:hypothetical protein [Bacteroidota bacterium]HHU25041.1 hypothetical protein [Bacteroidales bacterium]
MERIVLEVDGTSAKIWNSLSDASKKKLTSRVFDAVLRGELYPTGSEQLELAIELAEEGVSNDIISKLTRLEPEMFEAFLQP